MTFRLVCGASLAALLLACPPFARAQAPVKDTGVPSAQVLAEKIDQYFAKRWAEANAKPAAPADDAEFLRRVYLDLAGRIPSAAEARAFLKDAQPNKRARLVEQLLASPRYALHMTNVLRALLIPEANNNFLVRLQQGDFEAWLKKRVAANIGYDQLTRDLLTAPIGGKDFGSYFGGGGEPTALAFYTAKEFTPENLAAGTAKVFLGVSVECAQCHHHPFGDWKREQFWSFAAFFSGIKSQRLMDFLLPGTEVPDSKSLTIPGTDKVVQAAFLDNTKPDWQKGSNTRATLAQWVTSPANPYYSRTAVNRTWAYFFGIGLVEPLDEIAGGAATGHTELLDTLAKEFADHQFDLKFLIRALTATQTYQLSSAAVGTAQDDPPLFDRMTLRSMTGEQLFDSLVMATGYRDSGSGSDLLSAITGGNRSARSEFLTKFANPTERPAKVQMSILQALALMNGKVITDATSLEQSETLAAVLDAPFMSTADRIETLYLATLSRKPTAKELQRADRFVADAVKRAGATAPAQAAAYNNALADVFWVLLNSSEFALNH
jgi:hypothetical protein